MNEISCACLFLKKTMHLKCQIRCVRMCAEAELSPCSSVQVEFECIMGVQ